MRFILILAPFLAAACAPAATVVEQAVGGAESIAVTAAPVALNPGDPAQAVVGRLRYLGGLHLTSPDRRFGGLSGLRWHEGRLFAISDQGDFFRLTLEERSERLVGVRDVRIRRLARPDGTPLQAKEESDAEALELHWDGPGCPPRPAACPPSAAVIAFEGSNALWRYRLVDGMPESAPEELDWSAEWRRGLPHNGGVEAMADGWLLAEQLREPDGRASGRLIEGGGREVQLNLSVSDDFAPTDADRADALPGRPIFVLQRRYSPEAGNATRIVWFRETSASSGPDREVAGLETLAEILPPLTVDNFEGLAFRGTGGRYLYIISDDNFSPTQRTLLLKFQIIDRFLITRREEDEKMRTRRG